MPIRSNQSGNRQLRGLPPSRSTQRVDNNLGIVSMDNGGGKHRKFRSETLNKYDLYYDGLQYEDLSPWDASTANSYIPVRQRKPRIIYPFARRLASTVASKLVGDSTFPKLTVADDEDTTMFLEVLSKISHINTHILNAVRKMAVSGSSFLRFYFVNGFPVCEVVNAKYCYPVLDELGELEEIEIKYTYKDESDRDKDGQPIEKWYRTILTKSVDVLFDNPRVTQSQPTFEVVSEAAHNFGFVQGEWFRTSKESNRVDGDSLLYGLFDFMDELNYNLSQSSQSISYNQEPQTIINNMDEDEIDALIRSSQKAWNMGREGKAEFLESDLGAVEVAGEFREKSKHYMSDVCRIVLLDPEKIVGHAQSGKALEILHGPLVELIQELRPFIEDRIIAVLEKMAAALLMLRAMGALIGMAIPPGWAPQSLDITAAWPPVFPPTMADLKDKVTVAVAASNGSLISRATLTRWLAADFGVKNPDEEIALIAAQPVLNPFGAF